MEVTINVSQYLIASGTLMAAISIAILYMAVKRGAFVLCLSTLCTMLVWLYWVGSHYNQLTNL